MCIAWTLVPTVSLDSPSDLLDMSDCDSLFLFSTLSTSYRRFQQELQASPVTSASSPLPTGQAPPTPSVPQAFPRSAHDEHAHKVVIEWNDGEVSRFHNTWLYDHCRCERCFHPATKQRRKGLLEVRPTGPPDVQSRNSPTGSLLYKGSRRHSTVIPRTFPRWFDNPMVHLSTAHFLLPLVGPPPRIVQPYPHLSRTVHLSQSIPKLRQTSRR
jgi:hypothetical protein